MLLWCAISSFQLSPCVEEFGCKCRTQLPKAPACGLQAGLTLLGERTILTAGGRIFGPINDAIVCAFLHTDVVELDEGRTRDWSRVRHPLMERDGEDDLFHEDDAVTD